jgi:hypothetical protein
LLVFGGRIQRLREVDLPFDVAATQLTDKQQLALVEANAALVAIRERTLDRVRAADSAGMASWAFRSYSQRCLARVIVLGDGASSEWNARRLLNVGIFLRALVETVAAFYSLVDRGTLLITAGDLPRFHELTLRAMYGRRQGRDNHPELPEAANVLASVDRLTKVIPVVRQYYDSLCELVHPNSHGMNIFGTVNHLTYEVELDENDENYAFCVNSVMTGIRMIAAAPACFDMAEHELAPKIEALESRHGRQPSEWPVVSS